MLAPSSVTGVNIQLFWPETGLIAVCQIMKGMKKLLAGEYVPVHMRGKEPLAIVRGEDLASSSLCAAVGGKSQPTEI